MQLGFRKLAHADIPAYRELRLECLRDFPENFASDYAEQAALAQLGMEKPIAEGNSSTFIIGAFVDAALVGLVGLTQEQNLRQKHVATIIQMYVRPQFAGNKIGLKMLEFAIQEGWKIPEIEQIRLEVVTTSHAAIQVYRQAGFQEIGFYKEQMKIGDIYKDAIAMVVFRKEKAN